MIGKTYKLVHALDGMEAIQLYEKYTPQPYSHGHKNA